jgi:hypothetical protein
MTKSEEWRVTRRTHRSALTPHRCDICDRYFETYNEYLKHRCFEGVEINDK